MHKPGKTNSGRRGARLHIAAVAMVLLGLLSSACASRTAIVGARIYAAPDREAIEDAVLILRDGRIERVGTRAQTPVPWAAKVIEHDDAVIVAGFWNSHVHPSAPVLFDPAAAADAALALVFREAYLRWGFTTVFDLASSTPIALGIRERIEIDGVPGPRYLSVGDPFYPRGGTPIYAKPIYEKLGLPSAEIADVTTAVARVEAQAAAGMNGVKLFTGSIVGGAHGVLPMDLAAAAALTEAAHRAGQVVFAHPTNATGLQVAIDAGVDLLAHASPQTGAWASERAQQLAVQGIGLIPTLLLFETHADPSTPVPVALQQVRALLDAGGDILFGTDAGYLEIADPAGEYRLMAEVMSWREVLATLTTTPARRYGYGARSGRIEAGYDADLIVLDADPAQTIAALARVRETWRGGRRVYVAD